MDPPHVLLTLNAQMHITPLQTTTPLPHQQWTELVNAWQDTIEVMILLVGVRVFPQGVDALLHNPVITCR